MIAGGEVFTFLAGLDAFLFWNAPAVLTPLLWAALGLSLLVAAGAFRHIWRCERAGVAHRVP